MGDYTGDVGVDAHDWAPQAVEDEVFEGDEYAPGELEARADDPGIPDELVEVIAKEPVQIADINLELISENSPLLLMALVAIALTETVKGLGLRLLLREKGVVEDVKETIYRLVLFVVSAAAANTIGFRRLVLDVTGVSLSWFESIVYGGAIVSVIASIIYSMKLTKALKRWIYAKFGTTEEEMAAPTVKGVSPVTADDIQKHLAESKDARNDG